MVTLRKVTSAAALAIWFAGCGSATIPTASPRSATTLDSGGQMPGAAPLDSGGQMPGANAIPQDVTRKPQAISTKALRRLPTSYLVR